MKNSPPTYTKEYMYQWTDDNKKDGRAGGYCWLQKNSICKQNRLVMLNEVRIFELRKKIFEFEFVFDPSKFDFQIPTGLNSAKSVLWLH